MFQVFGEKELPMIKSNDPPSKIANWKKKKEVANCYKKLFEPMSSDSDKLVLGKIIEKVLPSEENQPKIQVALIIAVCVAMLNPKYERIQLDEKIMKSKVGRFLVSFCAVSVIYS